eukprot:maker-scaffold_1-snap-gene-2.6-mRNA-1 protein AED:0.04 eAED:0.04 QI:383/1/1/1/0.75/0.6/5/118/244
MFRAITGSRGTKASKTKAKNDKAPVGNSNDPLSALKSLKQTQGNLEKRTAFLRKKADNQLKLAQTAKKQNKTDDALMHLKKRKIIENEITTLNATILTLDKQILGIESGAATVDAVKALNLAKNTMSKINSKVNPDLLAELLEDLEDLNADQEEINGILTQGVTDGLDDQDLLDELEALDEPVVTSQVAAPAQTNQMSDADAELLKTLTDMNVPSTEPITLPSPTKTPVSKEEEELQMLMGSMV